MRAAMMRGQGIPGADDELVPAGPGEAVSVLPLSPGWETSGRTCAGAEVPLPAWEEVSPSRPAAADVPGDVCTGAAGTLSAAGPVVCAGVPASPGEELPLPAEAVPPEAGGTAVPGEEELPV